MAATPRLALPELAAAQSQKHVTVNQALAELDALVGLYIISNTLSSPPGSPADGDCYIVAGSPTGTWTGQSGKIAAALGGSWSFYPSFKGAIAYVASAGDFLVYNGTSWVSLSSLMAFAKLGINASADTTNKLSVSSGAILFNHAGNGVQVKLNKSAAGDTASQLYQTGFSGRAEIGLTGDDSFHFKVSSNGSSWVDALVLDKSTGQAAFAYPLKTPSYTVAGLPGASPAGQIAYVSNEAGGAVLAFSDGTNWRRVTDRAVVS